MTQQEKKAHWDELKAAGVQFKKHYREYTTEQLGAAVQRLRAGQAQAAAEKIPVAPQPEPSMPSDWKEQMAREREALLHDTPIPSVPAVGLELVSPVAEKDTIAGLRQNTHAEDEPLRVDPDGTIWYQDEVRKSAMPRPRGRRVLKYVDPGVREETIVAGQFSEKFEMPGEGVGRPAEAKITLPSFQTGIYKPKNSPFKIHTYNGARGFDLFQVEEFYGGSDMVPADVKRIYVGQTLCYDIRTTVRAVQAEARDIRLTKGLPR